MSLGLKNIFPGVDPPTFAHTFPYSATTCRRKKNLAGHN